MMTKGIIVLKQCLKQKYFFQKKFNAKYILQKKLNDKKGKACGKIKVFEG